MKADFVTSKSLFDIISCFECDFSSKHVTITV